MEYVFCLKIHIFKAKKVVDRNLSIMDKKISKKIGKKQLTNGGFSYIIKP